MRWPDVLAARVRRTGSLRYVERVVGQVFLSGAVVLVAAGLALAWVAYCGRRRWR